MKKLFNDEKKFIYFYNILLILLNIVFLTVFFLNHFGFKNQKTIGIVYISVTLPLSIIFITFSFLYLFIKKLNDNKIVKKIYKLIYKGSPFYIITSFIFFLIFTCFLSIGQIDGTSMENTFHHGERYLTYTYNFSPNNNDFLILNTKEDKLIIKRLIAKQGDKLEFEKVNKQILNQGNIFIETFYYLKVNNKDILDIKHNTKAAFKKYEIENMLNKKIDINEKIIKHTLEKEKYLVIGDNFENSKDSRFYGLFLKKDIIGKVLKKIL